jgi:hypothetical protein
MTSRLPLAQFILDPSKRASDLDRLVAQMPTRELERSLPTVVPFKRKSK